MNRTLKLSFVFGGIFISGVVVGAIGARRAFPLSHPPLRAGAGDEGFSPRTMRRLSTELGLTEEQRAAINPILQKAGDDLRHLRQESLQQTTAIFEAMDASLAEQFTPAQRERFAELKAAQRARMKAVMEERTHHKGDADGARRDGHERPIPRESQTDKDSR